MYLRDLSDEFVEQCEQRGFITRVGIIGYIDGIIGFYVVVIRNPCPWRVFGKFHANQPLLEHEGFFLRRFIYSVCFFSGRKFHEGTPTFQTLCIPS